MSKAAEVEAEARLAGLRRMRQERRRSDGGGGGGSGGVVSIGGSS